MAVPTLIGFVNSAPAVWTTNGRCCGGSLTQGAEAEYARYLADVVVQLDAAEGATLSFVSPMNEPDNSFAAANQEGMSVPVLQRAAVVIAVAAELVQRAPFARVIGDESSRILDEFLPKAPIWLRVEGGASAVAAVAHHMYDFPIDLELRAANLEAAAFGKPLWMTEICCLTAGLAVGDVSTIRRWPARCRWRTWSGRALSWPATQRFTGGWRSPRRLVPIRSPIRPPRRGRTTRVGMTA